MNKFIEEDRVLAVGLVVEVRWTNKVPSQIGAEPYPVGREIIVPRCQRV